MSSSTKEEKCNSEFYIIKPTCRNCKKEYEMRNDYFGIEALKDTCPQCLSEYGKTWSVL